MRTSIRAARRHTRARARVENMMCMRVLALHLQDGTPTCCAVLLPILFLPAPLTLRGSHREVAAYISVMHATPALHGGSEAREAVLHSG